MNTFKTEIWQVLWEFLENSQTGKMLMDYKKKIIQASNTSLSFFGLETVAFPDFSRGIIPNVL